MKRIHLFDKEFQLAIPASDIKRALWRIADKMNNDLKGENPLMVSVLNGSFMFSADLLKLIEFPCQISFVKISSYRGLGTSGEVKQLFGLTEDLKDRTVVLLEDIVDTGITLSNTIKQLQEKGPRTIKVATLLFKPDACIHPVKLDYLGMEIPNKFIVGYGLDYDGYGRNLPDIYSVVE